MDNPETLAALGTQNTGQRQTKQKTQHRKLEWWATWSPPKNWGWTLVLWKGNQFLLLIRHLPYNLYS
jgi:hypothetical protein